MNRQGTRLLLSAYQCAPGQGSVSQIGWEWYSRLARQMKVTLVTHVRNREVLESAGAPLHGSEVVYIDTEWFAKRWYALSRRLFPRSEHSVFLLSSLDYFLYDAVAARRLHPRAGEWDLVHAVTPVSPSAHTGLSGLGLPLVRGPLNGGLRTPKNFLEFMRADSAWFYPLREAALLYRRLAPFASSPSVILAANRSTEQALPPRQRAVTLRMPEIAVDPSLFPAAAWPDPPGYANPLRILFAGRLIPAKALPLLFRAAQSVARRMPATITVIGDGPMRHEWQQAASNLNLPVDFLGACTQAEVALEMQRCHVFCLPSIRESGGAVLLEAMSAARPVLAVDYGGPAELVNDEVGRLVPAHNPESVVAGLAAALQDIFDSPWAWKARGEAGRRHVLAQHTWDARIETAIGLYTTMTLHHDRKESSLCATC
jgi:glycosyltransferase involved in cell wall biosynthesis